MEHIHQDELLTRHWCSYIFQNLFQGLTGAFLLVVSDVSVENEVQVVTSSISKKNVGCAIKKWPTGLSLNGCVAQI
jgi:hypothetical protein